MAEKTTEKMVRIRLFKDDNEYRDDLIASVNGRTYTIKRGVDVEVPECIAEVIRHSDEQRMAAMETMHELQERSKKALN